MMQEQHAGSDALEAADNWRTKAFVIGGLVGAVVGVGAAYLYVSAAEQLDEPPEVKPGDAVTIGLAILALLRQIAGMRPDEDKGRKKKR